MCNPVAVIAVAGLAIEVGSEIANHNAQADAFEKNKKAAEEASKNSMTALSIRNEQEKRGQAQTIYQMDLEARRGEAITKVQAGESGVAGTSVDLLLSDIERQKLGAETGVKRNSADADAQLALERQGVHAQTQNQINSVTAPNPWATGLRIGGKALDTTSQYLQNRNQGSSR